MLSRTARVYSNPTAQTKVNGVLAEPFPIKNGTRQGCPLPPLLFALSLEPFLSTIRLDPDIQGVMIDKTQHKILAYADDMLFSLTNPVVSLPNLLKQFDIYGTLSNLKINFTKSEAMEIALPSRTFTTLQSSFRLRWTSSSLNYLGMSIPADPSRIYELNFPPLLAKTKVLLEKWHMNLHSWFGKG